MTRTDSPVDCVETFRAVRAAPPRGDAGAHEPRRGVEATRALYGLDDPDTEEFGRQCLLARRMVERGVRFVELLRPYPKGHDRWDPHTGLEAGHARATDKPIAALIRDLKARGSLDETIVIWGGEFGRTPRTRSTSTTWSRAS